MKYWQWKERRISDCFVQHSYWPTDSDDPSSEYTADIYCNTNTQHITTECSDIPSLTSYASEAQLQKRGKGTGALLQLLWPTDDHTSTSSWGLLKKCIAIHRNMSLLCNYQPGCGVWEGSQPPYQVTAPLKIFHIKCKFPRGDSTVVARWEGVTLSYTNLIAPLPLIL